MVLPEQLANASVDFFDRGFFYVLSTGGSLHICNTSSESMTVRMALVSGCRVKWEELGYLRWADFGSESEALAALLDRVPQGKRLKVRIPPPQAPRLTPRSARIYKISGAKS